MSSLSVFWNCSSIYCFFTWERSRRMFLSPFSYRFYIVPHFWNGKMLFERNLYTQPISGFDNMELNDRFVQLTQPPSSIKFQIFELEWHTIRIKSNILGNVITFSSRGVPSIVKVPGVCHPQGCPLSDF